MKSWSLLITALWLTHQHTAARLLCLRDWLEICSIILSIFKVHIQVSLYKLTVEVEQH